MPTNCSRPTNSQECGFFYEPEALTSRELKLLVAYARSQKRRLLTREQFVEEVVLRPRLPLWRDHCHLQRPL